MRIRLIGHLVLSICFQAVPAAHAGRVRTLIVTIDQYADSQGDCNALLLRKQQLRGFTLKRPGETTPACPGRGLPFLQNAVHDGDLFQKVLTDRFGLSTKTDIERLSNRQATAEAILSTLHRTVATLHKGDRFVFYFAGHGTTISNTKGGTQEALVPWDFELGAYPIMDFELVRIYREAIDKGSQVTIVFDSCFAGGTARGIRQRSARDGRIVDAPKYHFDDRGSFALIAAARGQEPATDEPQTFTQALVDVIEGNPVDLSVAELAHLTQARMVNKQSPVAEGGAKEQVNVVGQRVTTEPLTYSVTQVTGRRITIAAGRANGLTVGSVLGGPDGATFKIIDIKPTLADLEPERISPLPKAGSSLKLIRWQMEQEDGMRVYVPDSLPSAMDVDKLRSCLANTDPGLDTDAVSNSRVSWSPSGWQLTSADGKLQPFQCEQVRSLPGSSVVVTLPPTRELREHLEKDLGPYRDLIQNTTDAEFEVVGRVRDGRLEYALARRVEARSDMLPRMTEWNRDWMIVRGDMGLGEPRKYPEQGQTVDCAAQTQFCSHMLMRRIQRTRILMDLRRIETISSHIVTENGNSRIPWRIEMREKSGDNCTQRTVTDIVAEKEYCLAAAYTGPPGGAGWYLHVVTIDGAGLFEGIWRDDKKYATDEVLAPKFFSIATEGNRENFFLFATMEASLSPIQLDPVFQEPPARGSNRSRIRRKTVDFGTGGAARGDSPEPRWGLISASFVVRPKSQSTLLQGKKR